MNIYEKLQNMRVELQQKNIKKSGKNKFAGYEYYELSDILPPINELQSSYKTCSFISFNKEEAVLTIVNSEKPEEQIMFSSPMAELTLKGGQEIQNLGGVETYQRRYLYMAAFEIVENDYFDSVQGMDHKPKKQNQAVKKDVQNKPLSKETQEEINRRIMEYAKVSKMPVSEITAELTKVVKKELIEITNTEAKMVVSYLGGKINKAMEGAV